MDNTRKKTIVLSILVATGMLLPASLSTQEHPPRGFYPKTPGYFTLKTPGIFTL